MHSDGALYTACAHGHKETWAQKRIIPHKSHHTFFGGEQKKKRERGGKACWLENLLATAHLNGSACVI
jgi:hypothetical protein